MNKYSFDDFNKPSEQPEQKASGVEWFRPQTGSCRVRIVSNFIPVYQHWINKKATLCVGPENNCPFDEEHRLDVEYMMLIIDRVDNKLKIGNFNKEIMEHIAVLKANPDYAFTGLFPEYDLVITKSDAGTVVKKDGSVGHRWRWSVTGSRNETPLTPDEQAMIAAEAAKGTTVEQILERRITKAKKLMTPLQAVVAPVQPVSTMTAAPTGVPVNTSVMPTATAAVPQNPGTTIVADDEDDDDLPSFLK